MFDLVQIQRLGTSGDGVADGEPGAILVPKALPGETVRIDRSGRKARLIAIEGPSSADRIDPFCAYYDECGGCVFQHLEPVVYAEWKRDKVAHALSWAGLPLEVGPLIDAHGEGRRRVVLHARRIDGEVQVGFMEAGSHRLIPIESCPITVPALREAPRIAARLAAQLVSVEKPVDIAVTATLAGLDIELRGSGPPGDRRRQNLIGLAGDLDLARLAVHGEVLIERRRPGIPMGPSVVVPPPGAFLQATAAGEATLAGIVVAALGKAKRVVDLFSGVGPFALRIAGQAEVHAVEGQAAMLASLDRAARETPGLRRITTETRDLFRRPLLPPEFDRFDAMVIDPPRQGAEAQVRQVIPSSLDHVIMVSCDAGTFARDAASLVEGGFAIESVQAVDQFRWSAHVEIVGVFRRQRARGKARGGRRR